MIALFIIGLLVAAICIFIYKNVNPMIITLSNEKIKELTNDAVSNAVIDVMGSAGDVDYLSIERDTDGNIQTVDVNAELISTLAQKITIEAQHRINKVGRDGIKIPLGSLSGVTLFTGLGPDINVKVYLVGSTQTQILSVFSDAGINQTLHRLYLTVTGSVAVAVPGLPSTIKTSTQVLMSELIIVGDVPSTYLNASHIGDMLDLVVR
ncbi:MAG: sporulation protein YunB [Clostridiales bacterium]|nr:sporulation protein YunB [Clostridiales bacterium]